MKRFAFWITVFLIFHFCMVDFVGLNEMKFDFQQGAPFKPFQQLMGVLPAASSEHIPVAYRVSCPS